MSRAYIVCYNCDSDYCYCSDPNLEVQTTWGFEPLLPTIYPSNILLFTNTQDEDEFIDFWFDTFESFETEIPTIYIKPRIHPLSEEIARLHQYNNW
jgi:hypothetical protein